MARQELLLLAATLAVALTASTLMPQRAHADMRRLLLGQAGTKKLGQGVFEVTARGNNMRERRSSFEVAAVKAAKRAVKEKAPYFVVLEEKSGSWLMGGRRIGDETTLRFKLLSTSDPVLDEHGRPARVLSVADLLAQEK